jgi:hypothetical protein
MFSYTRPNAIQWDTHPEGETAVFILTPRNWKLLAGASSPPADTTLLLSIEEASRRIACTPAVALRVTLPEEAGPDCS